MNVLWSIFRRHLESILEILVIPVSAGLNRFPGAMTNDIPADYRISGFRVDGRLLVNYYKDNIPRVAESDRIRWLNVLCSFLRAS